MDADDTIGRIRRWLPKTGSIEAYIIAGILIGVGVVLRFALDEIAEDQLPPYITLYPVVVVAAFAGGIRVGLFAMALSAVAAWLFWLPPPVPGAMTTGRIATGLVFLITGGVTVACSGAARLLLDKVIESEAARTRAAREAVHRIKNLVAVTQSLSRKISRDAGDVATYRDRLDERLSALAIAQDMLVKGGEKDISLRELVRASLAPFTPNPRLELKNELDTIVPRRLVTPLSMALYELATNSMKYGALSSPTGHVRLIAEQRDGRCSLDWHEIGLSQVSMGESAGLGSLLIRSALSAIEGGVVRYDISPQSVSCLFDWPANDHS